MEEFCKLLDLITPSSTLSLIPITHFLNEVIFNNKDIKERLLDINCIQIAIADIYVNIRLCHFQICFFNIQKSFTHNL